MEQSNESAGMNDQVNPAKIFASLRKCKGLIIAAKFGHRPSTHNQWEASACPNKRVKEAFNIDNSFNCTSRDHSNHFRTNVEAKLYFDMAKWSSQISSIKRFADTALTGMSEVNISEIIQVLVMRATLTVLFEDHDIDETLADEDIKFFARKVNEQWLRSKGVHSPNDLSWKLADQNALRKALRKVFPNRNIDDKMENPMNLILPGYEFT